MNHTLSQSVPGAILTTVNGYTKIFIGLLIERALEIQQQQAGHLPTPPPDAGRNMESDPDLPLDLDFDAGQSSSFDSGLFSPTTIQHSSSAPSTQSNSQATTDKHHKEPLGPLLPDHIREAFRRYKMNGESGGIGVQGLSLRLSGKDLCAARLHGGRLFR